MFKKNTGIGFDLKWDRIDNNNHFKRAMKFIFEQSGQLDDMVIINGLPVLFSKTQKAIGVSFSGGADSTLMLYLLCRIIKEFNLNIKIVALTTIRFWEQKIGADYVSANILKYFKASLFPDIEIIHEFGFIPTALETTPLSNIQDLPPGYFTENELKFARADIYASLTWNKYISNKYDLVLIYNGTTMNPAHLGDNVNAPRHRAATDFIWSRTKNFTSPFKLINKDWVMAQYDNFGLQDLAKMTKSCNAGEQEIIEKFGTKIIGNDMQKYSCGTCFFCHERLWATENINPYLEITHK